MRARLNEKNATALALKQTGYEVRDEVVRGLILRVGAKGGRGDKVWEVVVSTGPKTRRRIRLGHFPAVSVKEARLAATSAKEVAVRPDRTREVRTVGDLFERYEAARSPQMRAWRDVKSAWQVWGKDQLAHVRLADVTAHHGLDLRDHVASRSSPLRGASVIRYLRPMFSWAEEEQLIRLNPWASLKAREVAVARDRVLTSTEWQKIWEATVDLPYPWGPFVRALMLSGQRLSNVASMRWDELHADVWTIPAAKVKATRAEKATAHEVPLSKSLSRLIAEQPRRGPFVFTTTGDKAITPGSKIKMQLERRVNAAALESKGGPLDVVETLTDWRFHDIRRTAATRMTERGISRFIVERVLGHADRGVTAIYDRNAYREEKRSALEVLAATVEAHSSGLEKVAGLGHVGR